MKYWYFDNWNGRKIGFDTLNEALISARNADGVAVTIFDKNGVSVIVRGNGKTYS